MKRCFPTELAEIKDVEILISETEIRVTPIWKVYSENYGGWSLKPTHYNLAIRLATAIKAGKVCLNPTYRKYSFGNGGYVTYVPSIKNENMSKELKQLGF